MEEQLMLRYRSMESQSSQGTKQNICHLTKKILRGYKKNSTKYFKRNILMMLSGGYYK